MQRVLPVCGFLIRRVNRKARYGSSAAFLTHLVSRNNTLTSRVLTKGFVMKKLARSFPLALALSVTLGCFGGAAYALNFGALHSQHEFYDLSYVYRNGWDRTSEAFPTLKVHSYMWVRNNVRTVGEDAIFSQAGLTNISSITGNHEAIFGSGVWNENPNPAGVAVEDYVSEMIPMFTSVTAWGNGFVRDPDSQYHHCPTEENVVFEFHSVRKKKYGWHIPRKEARPGVHSHLGDCRAACIASLSGDDSARHKRDSHIR